MVSCRKIEYPGVAQLVAHVIWERAVLIHDVKNATPQPAGTLSEAGYFSLEKEVKNRR